MRIAKELLSSRSEIVIESFTPCEPAVNKIEKRRRETNRKHKTALHCPPGVHVMYTTIPIVEERTYSSNILIASHDTALHPAGLVCTL